MYPKRGIVLLVVVLLLFLGLAIEVRAQELVLECSTEFTDIFSELMPSKESTGSDCNDNDEKSFSSSDGTDQFCTVLFNNEHAVDDTCGVGTFYSGETISFSDSYGIRKDDPENNDVYKDDFKYWEAQQEPKSNPTKWSEDSGDSDIPECFADFSGDPVAYLCAESGSWHVCNEAVLGQTQVVAETTYTCSASEGGYFWRPPQGLTYQYVRWADQCGQDNDCISYPGENIGTDIFTIRDFYPYLSDAKHTDSSCNVLDWVQIPAAVYTNQCTKEGEDFLCDKDEDTEATLDLEDFTDTPGVGCYIGLVFDGTGATEADECGWTIVAKGDILGATNERAFKVRDSIFEYADGGMLLSSKRLLYDLIQNKRVKVPNNELICQNDGIWLECNQATYEQHHTTPITINDENFYCFVNPEGKFVWLKDDAPERESWKHRRPWQTEEILFDGNDGCTFMGSLKKPTKFTPWTMGRTDSPGVGNIYPHSTPEEGFIDDALSCVDEFPVAMALASSDNEGCFIGVYEDDDDDDDCGIGLYKQGAVVSSLSNSDGSRITSNDFVGSSAVVETSVWYWESDVGLDEYDNEAADWDRDDANWPADSAPEEGDDPDDAALCFDHTMSVKQNEAYLCNNKRWYRCDADVEGEVITLIEEAEDGEAEPTEPSVRHFVCLSKGVHPNNFYDWYDAENLPFELDSDSGDPSAPGDNVPDKFDCNQFDDTVHGDFPVGCEAEKAALPPALRENFYCVPAASEICGDGKNNDCLGYGKNEWLPMGSASPPPTPPTNEQYWLTQAGEFLDSSDICNENKFACQGLTVNINAETGEPKTVSGGGCLQSGRACSWVDDSDSSEKNNCCGDTGIKDLGEVSTVDEGGELSPGEYICLSKLDGLVGRASTETEESMERGFSTAAWPTELGGEESLGGRCQGEWCWVAAFQDQFHIYTINKPDGEPYDVVSNSEKWFFCKEGSPPADYSLSSPAAADFWDESNRFLCYNEGNHFSWAECVDYEDQPYNLGSKRRYAGEGSFNLPLAEETGDASAPQPQADKIGVVIDIDSSFAEKYYGEDYLFDFSAFNQLNFLVQFCADATCSAPATAEQMVKPAGIQVEMKLPDIDVPLWEKEVLADVTNNPLFGSGFMLMQVSLPEGLQGIEKVRLKSLPEGTGNILRIKSVYLTIAENSETQMLCSGKTSSIEDTPNWLLDGFDAGEERFITGERLCKEIYGDAAWLGRDVDLDLGAETANCCGNQKSEYYVGLSAVAQSPEHPEIAGKNFACWNSQPVEAGKTITNVQFEVEYGKLEQEVEYGADGGEVTFRIKQININYENLESPVYLPVTPARDGADEFQLSPFTSFKKIFLIEVTQSLIDNYHTNIKKSTLQGEKVPPYTGMTVTPFIDLSYYNPLTAQPPFRELTKDQLILGQEIWIMAKLDDDYCLKTTRDGTEETPPSCSNDGLTEETAFTISRTLTSEETAEPLVATFSCNQDQCLFPLPDGPKYKITNPHPDLYDLYFVKGNDPRNDVLITQENQEFIERGNLKAKRIAQQVLLIHNANLQKFVACNAPDFILHPKDSPSTPAVETSAYDPQSKSSCSVFDLGSFSYYCSPSTSENGKTTLNQWFSQPLPRDHTGYFPITEDLPPEELELSLYDGTDDAFQPYELQYSSSAVYGKNILPNAHFEEFLGRDVFYWEIIVFDKPVIFNSIYPQGELSFRSPVTEEGEEVFTISHSEDFTLRSAPIPVPAYAELDLSTEIESCTGTIKKFTNDGKTPEEGQTTSYVVAEFKKSEGCGTVKHPLLQIVDGSKPKGKYSYPEKYPSLSHPRSALSCCPENYCWNGFACVAPMEDTIIVEHLDDGTEFGRNYRCIEGQWVDTPRRFDWNSEKQGFCRTEKQCFVLSSALGANPLVTGSNRNLLINPEAVATFTPIAEKKTYFDKQSPTKLPQCLNSGDYIMDNYCDNGVWTSRTKFLAADLLALGEIDEEYSLYCTSPASALLEFDDQHNKILGDPSGRLGTGTLLSSGEETFTCFTTAEKSEEQRLIPDQKNTCVNSICILKNKEGKVVFGTTANHALDNDITFVDALKLNKQSCLTSTTTENEYAVCIKEAGKNLWHHPEKNIIIFSKELDSLQGSLLDRLLEFLGGFLGREAEPSAASVFTKDAENFHDIYLLKKSDKEVHAVLQSLPRQGTESEGRKALLVEYQNFKSPLCQYLNEQRLQDPFTSDLLAAKPVSCTTDSEFQRAEIVVPAKHQKALFALWPQLTGKLRVE